MDHSLENFTKLRLILDTDGVGPAKLFNLLAKFNSLDNLLGANYNSLISVEGISYNLANRILKKINSYKEVLPNLQKELDRLYQLNIKWTTFWSENYPKRLQQIFAPPIILYYSGNLECSYHNTIAIVGTRNATRYGKANAEKFAKELSLNGITVVSGMARGVDTFAHKGALSAKGKTLAVLGSGLDNLYPPENKALFDEIRKNGVVISEYPLGTKPDAQNFPKRNRIISGISLGALVVETKPTGGAMQTASLALEQNREVFAIPGNIGVAQSKGTNLLIQRGEAKLVINCEDILSELNLKVIPQLGRNFPKPLDDLNIFERNVLDLLSDEPKHIDWISHEAKMSPSDCLINLLSLEFREYIKQLPGKTFIKL